MNWLAPSSLSNTTPAPLSFLCLVLLFWWHTFQLSYFVSTAFLLCLCHLPKQAEMQFSAVVPFRKCWPMELMAPKTSPAYPPTKFVVNPTTRVCRAAGEPYCWANWDWVSVFSFRRELLFFFLICPTNFLNTTYFFQNVSILFRALPNESTHKKLLHWKL